MIWKRYACIMKTLLELRDQMQESPFRPFRIHTSDGKSYDTTNHDMSLADRNCQILGHEV